MDIPSKRLVGWFRGPATGNNAAGVYGLVTMVVAVLLTYSIVVTISVVVPLLSTTAIALLSVSVWLVTWAVLGVVTNRTLWESGG